MRPENVANINIDKHRELFEYEMTEVLLNLKGEFATFSGMGTRYVESAVAEERLEIPNAVIPRVVPEKIHIAVSLQYQNAGFTCPSISCTTPVEIKLPNRPSQYHPFRVSSPQVSISVPDYTLPEQTALVDTPSLKKADLVIPTIPQPQNYSLMDAKPAAIRISIPQISAVHWKPADYVSKAISAPKTRVPAAHCATIPVQFPPISLREVVIDVPSTAIPTTYPNIGLEQKKTEQPAIPDTALPSFPVFSMNTGSTDNAKMFYTGALRESAAAKKRYDEKFIALPQFTPTAIPQVPVKKTVITIPKIERQYVAVKLIRYSSPGITELPDLSVPAPPEIRLSQTAF